MSANSTLNLRRVGHEIAQCQHIRLSGLRCGSPALRGQRHCYYHSVIRQERPTATIPQLDDGLNIQFSLREIVQGIAVGKWDTKRAALLLYAMQIAASNLRAARAELTLARFDSVTDVPTKIHGAPFSARHAERKVGKKKTAAPSLAEKKPAQPATETSKDNREETNSSERRVGKEELPTLESALLTLQAAALKPPTIPIASEVAAHTNGGPQRSSA